MSAIDKIPQYTVNKDGQLRVQAPEVLIDDAFDALFNARAKQYLEDTYHAGPIGNAIMGEFENVNNALVGHKNLGLLGPSMGILGSFGRTMDKADDFLLGGLTEGVNAAGNLLGSRVLVQNPFQNIFVNDEDYSGKRLLAAMGNSLNKFSGLAPDALTEDTFKGIGWDIAGTGIDLATDPGILGGALAKANPSLKELNNTELLRRIGNNGNNKLAAVGQLLSNYDDIMAKPAWDLNAPGLRQVLGKFHNSIDQFLGITKNTNYSNVDISIHNKHHVNPIDSSKIDMQTPDSFTGVDNFSMPKKPAPVTPDITQATTDLQNYERMLDDVYAKNKDFYINNPDLQTQYFDTKRRIVKQKLDILDKVSPDTSLTTPTKVNDPMDSVPTIDKNLILKQQEREKIKSLKKRSPKDVAAAHKAFIDDLNTPKDSVHKAAIDAVNKFQDAMNNDLYEINTKLKNQIDAMPLFANNYGGTTLNNCKRYEKNMYNTYQEIKNEYSTGGFEDFVRSNAGTGSDNLKRFFNDDFNEYLRDNVDDITERIAKEFTDDDKLDFISNFYNKYPTFKELRSNSGFDALRKAIDDDGNIIDSDALNEVFQDLFDNESVLNSLYKFNDESNFSKVINYGNLTPFTLSMPKNSTQIKYGALAVPAIRKKCQAAMYDIRKILDVNDEINNKIYLLKGRRKYHTSFDVVSYATHVINENLPKHLKSADWLTIGNLISNVTEENGTTSIMRYISNTQSFVDTMAIFKNTPISKDPVISKFMELADDLEANILSPLSYKTMISNEGLNIGGKTSKNYPKAFNYFNPLVEEAINGDSLPGQLPAKYGKIRDSGFQLSDDAIDRAARFIDINPTTNLSTILKSYGGFTKLINNHPVYKFEEIEDFAKKLPKGITYDIGFLDDAMPNSARHSIPIDASKAFFKYNIYNNVMEAIRNSEINFVKYGATEKRSKYLKDAVGKLTYVESHFDPSLNKVVQTNVPLPDPIKNLIYKAFTTGYLNYEDAFNSKGTRFKRLIDPRKNKRVLTIFKNMEDEATRGRLLLDSEPPVRLLKYTEPDGINDAFGNTIEKISQVKENPEYIWEYTHYIKNWIERPEYVDMKKDAIPIEHFDNVFNNIKFKGDKPYIIDDEDLEDVSNATSAITENSTKIVKPKEQINTADEVCDEVLSTVNFDISHTDTDNLDDKLAKVTNLPNSQWANIDIDAITMFGKQKADTIKQYVKANYGNYPTMEQYREGLATLSDAKDVTLFDLIQSEKAVQPKNNTPDVISKATMNLPVVRQQLARAHQLAKEFKPDDVRKYITVKQAMDGDMILGKDFLSELASSKGRLYTILDSKDTKSISRIEKALTANSDILNANGRKLVTFFKKSVNDLGKEDSAGTRTLIGVALDTSNRKAIKDFRKLSEKEVDHLQNVIWQEAHPECAKSLARFKKLDDFFKGSQATSEELSRLAGFDKFSPNYVKHVMNNDEAAAKFITAIDNGAFNSSDTAELANIFCNEMQLKGAFGMNPSNRSIRGSLAEALDKKLFSGDLESITASTYTQGIFDNNNFQNHVDLFVNDNFKINRYAKTPEDLKRILYNDMSKGNTGNLDNLTLIAPKYDEFGKVSGYTRFNKLTDDGLQKALKNKDTILAPIDVVAHLDRLCRKDRRLSNKFYVAFNRLFTLPYKFGVLTNPGFLVGNANDAYLKQAVSMANKHGTSLSEELTKVGASVKDVINLNNSMVDTFEDFRYFCKNHTSNNGKVIKCSPNWVTYEALVKSPQAKEEFIKFLNMDSTITGVSEATRKKARLWMYINNFQLTPALVKKHALKDTVKTNNAGQAIFDRNIQDLGDLAEATTEHSKFSNGQNVLERILLGASEYQDKNPLTWGLFTNNPVANVVMKGSGEIESLARASSVLNDLKHTCNLQDLSNILEDSSYSYKDVYDRLNPLIATKLKDVDIKRRSLDVKMSEAVNSMFFSNFNYEDIPNSLDAVTGIIPFPTFYIRNLGFWLKIFNENPQMIDNMVDFQTGMWQGHDQSNSFTAEAKGRGGIPIGSGDGQGLSNLFQGIYKPTALNSMFGAFSAINNPAEDMKNRVHPLIKLATSPTPLYRKDEVQYRPHNMNQYQRNIQKGDPNFNPLEYMFHALNPYERAMKTGLRTPGKVLKGNAQASDFLPSIYQPDFSKKRK